MRQHANKLYYSWKYFHFKQSKTVCSNCKKMCYMKTEASLKWHQKIICLFYIEDLVLHCGFSTKLKKGKLLVFYVIRGHWVHWIWSVGSMVTTKPVDLKLGRLYPHHLLVWITRRSHHQVVWITRRPCNIMSTQGKNRLVLTHLNQPWGPPWTLATLGDMLENDQFPPKWSFSSMLDTVKMYHWNWFQCT